MANNAVVGLLRTLLVADTAEFDDAMKRSGSGAQDWARNLKLAGNQAQSVGQQISSGLGESLTKLAAAFSISHLADSAIESVVEFGKSAFTTAAQIVDLSAKLGLSTDAIQKYKFVAEQSGTTVDAFGTAIFKLGVTLQQGGTATTAALRDLGLTAAQLKALSPEAQFDLVARALGGLTDVQQRNRDGVALMGRGYAEIAAGIADYTTKVGGANVVEEERLRALAATKVAYDGLIATIESKFTSAVGGAVLEIDRANKSGMAWYETLIRLGDGSFRAALAQHEHNAALAEWNKSAAQRGQGKDVNLPAQTPISVDYSAELVAARKQIDALTVSQKAQIDAALKLGTSIEELGAKYHLGADAQKIYTSYTAETAAAQQKATAEQEKAAEAAEAQAQAYRTEVQALADTYTGTKLAQQILLTADAVERAGGASAIAKVGYQELDKALVGFVAAGGTLPPILQDIYVNQDLWVISTTKLNAVLSASPNLVGAMTNQVESLDGAFKNTGVSVKWLEEHGGPNLVKDLAPPLDVYGEFVGTLGVLEKSFKSLAQGGSSAMKAVSDAASDTLSIMQEYQSISKMQGAQKNMAIAGAAAGQIGNVVAGIKSGSKAKGAIAGAEEGATIGMYGGPLGMAIGAGVGALAGAVAASKHNTTKDARTDLAKSLGFDDLGALYTDLQKKGGAAGAALANAGSSIIGRHDEAGNKAWMQQVQDFYDTLHKQQQTVLDDLDSADQAFADLGVTAPAALDDTINALLKAGDTKQAQDGMDGLTGALKKYQDQLAQADAFKSVEQEMQDVGLTADDMNAKFQQAADEESARTIAKQWADLAPYVSDVNVLADKFGDSMEKLAKDSLDYGTSIPASMKPVMQSLMDQGKILDDNGNKITDMGQLNWEEDPLATGLDALNKTLEDLVDVLKNELPAAAADGAQGMQDAYNDHPLVIPVHYAADDAPPSGGSGSGGGPAPQIGLSGGTHGQYVDWGAGTDVTLHGRERVVPEGEAVGGASGQPLHITVISQLDGKQVARNQVKYIPRELVLAGVRRAWPGA